MKQLLVPLILVIAAVGLFSLYTNPAYQTVKALSAQNTSYDDALQKAAELHSLRDQLLKTRANFPNDGIEKLVHVLPDNVDNIRLIIDINNIAARHSLTLTNVEIGTVSDSTQKRSSAAVASSGAAVGSVEVGFSIAANYDNFVAFLEDLEHSLRVVDVTQIKFGAPAGDLTVYNLSIKTYWLH